MRQTATSAYYIALRLDDTICTTLNMYYGTYDAYFLSITIATEDWRTYYED